MPYMPRAVLAEVPVGERPAARASTKYMETLQLSRPALGGTDITRALFVPDIQEATYYVPAIIGEVLIVVGYLGSLGVAIAELVEIVKADSQGGAAANAVAGRML
jgi:hypothetical protein